MLAEKMTNNKLLNNSKILIVGSNGYVGSNLIKYYSRYTKAQLFGISRTKNDSHLLKKNYIGNINDEPFLKSINQKFDIIINCAAQTKHFGLKKEFYETNVKSVVSLLSTFNGTYKTFIHLSSEAVFLNGKIPLLHERTPLPNKTLSDYAWSKNLAEREIDNFKQTFGGKIIVIRPRLIWGGFNSIVSLKLTEAIKNKFFFFVGHGDYLTSSTHIYNLYLGINKAIELGKNKQKYFIIDKSPIKFNKLINIILRKKINVPSLPRWLIYIMCNLADLLYYLSFKKIRLPISRSLYFLTFSEVIIDNSYTKKMIQYSPTPIEKLIREY